MREGAAATSLAVLVTAGVAGYRLRGAIMSHWTRLTRRLSLNGGGRSHRASSWRVPEARSS
jgi:hypothetical protein